MIEIVTEKQSNWPLCIQVVLVPSGQRSSLLIIRSLVWIPLGVEFISCMYGVSLHRAFHYYLTSSQYDLYNVEKDVKHQLIIIIFTCVDILLECLEEQMLHFLWNCLLFCTSALLYYLPLTLVMLNKLRCHAHF